MGKPVLVGDVGGTNVRFAIAREQNGRICTEQFNKFAGDDYDSFDGALCDYLDESSPDVPYACFAMAGPVDDGEVLLTNRQWKVSEHQLRQRFGFENVCLINDFKAMARSVPELEPAVFQTVLEGTPDKDKPVLVAGPGTGFGVATLFPLGGRRWKVISGEGGHTAYAPREPLEFDLAQNLMRKHGYVSNEIIASGMGLEAVHEAFCEIFGRDLEEVTPQEMRHRADAGDEMYDKLIALRANAVMGAVGDLALANGALGGVVLAGGVTSRILDYLKRPDAVARFRARGPMSGFLAECPISLMDDPEAPLIGAAAYYAQENLA